MYIIHRNGAFGDTLLTAQCVANLRAGGVDAHFYIDEQPKLVYYKTLLDVPFWDEITPATRWDAHYKQSDRKGCFVNRMLRNFCVEHHLPIVPLTLSRVPAVYYDMPETNGADVAYCFNGSGFAKVRNYPHGTDLITLLHRMGITTVNVESLRGVECLNVIKKSRLYLGVETGTTHYAATVQPNGVVIHSGFNSQDNWDHGYGYDVVSHYVPCAPCYIRECPYQQQCIRQILPSQIVAAVEARLK